MRTLPIVSALAAILLVSACGSTSDEDARRIERNLTSFYGYGLQYMLENGVSEARYNDLIGEEKSKFTRKIKPVNGENYHGLVVRLDTKSLSVRAADGREITFYVNKDDPLYGPLLRGIKEIRQ